MRIEVSSERNLRCVPELKFPRKDHVTFVGKFPRFVGPNVMQTEQGIWALCLYQRGLWRKRWRPGSRLPKPSLEEPVDTWVEPIRPGAWLTPEIWRQVIEEKIQEEIEEGRKFGCKSPPPKEA